MKFIKPILLTILIQLSINFTSKAQGVTGVQPNSIENIVENSRNSDAFWSVTVRGQNGEVLEGHNANKLVTPASNLKLYTTAAALDRLGHDYTYTTYIYSKGELKDSVWIGDLIIKGSGDPTISGVFYSDDREYVFKSFLKQLKEAGINEIKGKLLADISYFDTEDYPIGWDWYDMSFYYSVPIGPLAFNNNTFFLEVFAEGEVGERPRIEWYPIVESIVIHNNQTIVEADKKYDEHYRKRMGFNEYNLASFLPKGYYEDEDLAIESSHLFFLEAFELFLKNNNFKLNVQDFSSALGKTGNRDEFTVLASHTSKPLSEIIERINKESDNFYTEMVLKTLGAEKQNLPGSFDNGIWEVKKFLSEQTIDTNSVVMYDGSGLSASDKLTTRDLSLLMHKMKEHPQFEYYYNSFPIAAVDGSLEFRFKNTFLANNLRGKTGFINGVRSITGYMSTKSGNTITYSIVTNNFNGYISNVDSTHQEVLLYIYDKY